MLITGGIKEMKMPKNRMTAEKQMHQSRRKSRKKMKLIGYETINFLSYKNISSG